VSVVVATIDDVNYDDLAWCAGLYEGEGSAYTKTREGRLTVMIDMTDEDVVRAFHQRIGLGHVARSSKLPSGKICWRWSAASFEQGQAVLAYLWPWLGERRKAQATRVLQAERERVLTMKRPAADCLVRRMFGRPWKDLTPAQEHEYRRAVSARYRARKAYQPAR